MAQHTTRVIPKAAVSGIARGVFFMAIFGTLWAYIGLVGLNDWNPLWLWILPPIVGIALFSGGISLTRAAGQLTSPVSNENAQGWKKKQRWFGIIFATEGVTMGIVTSLCGATGHYDLIFPLMAIIAGLHFFPLAPLFNLKSHYVTGALLCLLSIITLLVVPARTMLGGQQIIAWWSVVGFGSALILWLTGLAILLYGRNVLRLGLGLSTQQGGLQSNPA